MAETWLKDDGCLEQEEMSIKVVRVDTIFQHVMFDTYRLLKWLCVHEQTHADNQPFVAEKEIVILESVSNLDIGFLTDIAYIT